MNKSKFANLVSFILHPIVFALLVPFLVVYKESKSISYGLEWTGISFIFLFLAAIVFLFLRPRTDDGSLNKDLEISIKKDRHIFYTICTVFTIIFFIVAELSRGIFFPLSIIALGMSLGFIIFNIVNIYMKVSIHVAVVTAYIFTFYVLYGFLPFLGILWLLPIIIWARLHLDRHTRREILTAVIIGGIVILATIFIAKEILP